MLEGKWEVSKSLLLTMAVFTLIAVAAYMIWKKQADKKAITPVPTPTPAGTTTDSGVKIAQ
jgi:hypothetical protein